MEEEVTESKLFGTFEKYDEFLSIQKTLLAVDLAAEPESDDEVQESDLFRRLSNIVSSPVFRYLVPSFTPYSVVIKLDEYQEQSYLLDPFLEQLVVPVVDSLKWHAKVSVSTTGAIPTARVGRVSRLL